MKQYNLVVSGGTFDHFHKGHEAFIRLQLEKSEKICIGITSNNYTVKNGKEGIGQSYEIRKKHLLEFLEKEDTQNRVEILPLEEGFIPNEWDHYSFDAIFVTKDTEKGAELINTRRKQQGKSLLHVVIAPMVLAEDALPIAATRIRQGIINRNGKVFLHSQWTQKDLLLPDTLRETLQKPFGEIVTDVTHFNKTLVSLESVTVGDVTTETFLRLGIQPFLAIVDLSVKRVPLAYGLDHYVFQQKPITKVITNPAGMITKEVFLTLEEIMQSDKKSVYLIHIVGEEDLMVLPLVILLPLGYTIFYGQPDKGMVKIIVSEKIKEHASSLLSLFKIA